VDHGSFLSSAAAAFFIDGTCQWVAARSRSVHAAVQGAGLLSFLKWSGVVAVVAYAALLGAMYVWQRSLMYFPERARTGPGTAGLPDTEEATLTTADGERVIVWHRPPQGDRPVFVYFHGNGGALRLRAERFRKLTADGAGLVALAYRGYGGSSGTPTEDGIAQDASAAYAFAAARYAPERLVVFGESLGTAVAVRVAAEHPVGKLILDAPYTSTADIAAAIYWYVPVRLLMHDQFRAAERIGRVKAPVLILHGERDRVVPIGFAEALYARIPGPKRFIRYPAGTHLDLDSYGAQDAIRAFVSEPAASE
jgi:fermentation-respiration switch protein FrsA (DUF1100 family)